MPNHNPQSIYGQFKKEADDLATLQIFDIIEQDARMSQQKISLKTGLATGLVHSFMRRIIMKGWIRAKQVNAKRWLYFMTPSGFAEKSRLTKNYLARTLKTYKSAQNVVQSQLGICLENNWHRLVVAGDNELAEITALNIRSSSNLTLVAVIAEKNNGEEPAGETVLPYDAIGGLNYHKVLVCDPNFLNWNMQNGQVLDNSKMLSILLSQIEF